MTASLEFSQGKGTDSLDPGSKRKKQRKRDLACFLSSFLVFPSFSLFSVCLPFSPREENWHFQQSHLTRCSTHTIIIVPTKAACISVPRELNYTGTEVSSAHQVGGSS